MEFSWLIIMALVVIGALILLPRLFRRTTVYEYERGLLYRRGVFQRVLGPGAYWQRANDDVIRSVDIRPRTAAVNSQELLTADGVAIKISIAMQYAIADPFRAVHASQSFYESLYLAAQLALRDIVTGLPIDDLLAQRGQIGSQLLAAVAPAAEELGLTVTLAQIKDITLPGDLKKVFGDVVRARKEGQAALERARGETAALRNLANAARMLDGNPSLLHLRALMAVDTAKGSSVVFNAPPTGEAKPEA